MKRLLIILALGLSGCVSTGVKVEQVQLAAAITRPTVQTLVVPLLNKHPEYESALVALAAGVDVVFSQGKIDAGHLRGYVEALATKYKIEESDKLVIALAIDNLYQFYVTTYQQPVMDAADPNVKLVVTAFAKGVLDGIAFYHAYKQAPTAPASWAPKF
jgi:hypothetical protein